MEIRDYQQGDEKQILKLFQLAFGREMSKEYWKWRFENNPAGAHYIKLMWEDDLLVGHYAVSPVYMNVGGDKMLTSLSMTTMTHPDFGGNGIFGKLAESLYQHIADKNKVACVWGFPNTNSHYGFIKNLQWKDVGVCHEIAVKKEVLRLNVSLSVNEIKSFNDEHETFIAQLNEHKISVVKDTQYLNWRYIENPTQKYRCFVSKSGNEISGIIVTKEYVTGKSKIINIIDLFCTNNIHIIESLISFAINSYTHEEISNITTWLNLSDSRYQLLEKMGFVPSGNITYLGYRNLIDQNDTFGDLKNWSYSFGDSDVY